jgi:hypothetical protein
MRSLLTLELGEFTREALDAQAARGGAGIASVVSKAVGHYFSQGGERAAWRLPDFRRQGRPLATAGALAVELAETDRRRLEERARLEQASPAQVLEHAALCYLADLAAGRVAAPEAAARASSSRPIR